MKYYMLLGCQIYHDFGKMLENAKECERFDVTDLRAFRVIVEEKQYALGKQYVFLNEKITLYELMPVY